MNQRQWEGYKNRSKYWSIRMSYELLHSKAYQEMKYGPAIKCLNYFYEKIRFEVLKSKRGSNRYRPFDDGKISFTYGEAHLRGLTDQQFSRTLKELHAHGFIDLEKHGSGMMGDYNVFTISQRWKEFGTPHFKKVEFPKSYFIGYRRVKKNRINDENSMLSNDENSLLESGINDENSMLINTTSAE